MSVAIKGNKQEKERFYERDSASPSRGGRGDYFDRSDTKDKSDYIETDQVERSSQSTSQNGHQTSGESSKTKADDREEGEIQDDCFSEETAALGTVKLFDDMDLRDDLLRGVYGLGFEYPSPIQQKAILPAIQGHDIIAQAQSGTGKTATFSISVLNRIDLDLLRCQALVLSPTRELAHQTWRVMNALADYMKVKIHACIGGRHVGEDAKKLQEGVHVVVGTPGRVLDMIKTRRALDPRDIRMFVVDEADVMLSRGFKEEIYEIFQFMSTDVQVILVSATMPTDVLDVTKNFMRDPVRILVKQEELTLEGIRQFYVQTEKEEFKLPTLCDLYETLTISQSVIFVNTRRKVDWLTEKMGERDFTVSSIHGDMDQKERDMIMSAFVNGSSRVLICTDLLARGVDVQQVSLVLNFDLPRDRENYIHR